MNDTVDLTKRAIALQELLASQQTLLLSTASVSGIPGISYAPFVRDGSGCFYILISELAAHTDNLFTNPQASVMFVRPESESNNLFARERAIFDCTVKEIGRSDDCYSTQLTALQNQFGEIVGVLRSLSDFHLFAWIHGNGTKLRFRGLSMSTYDNLKIGLRTPSMAGHDRLVMWKQLKVR